MTTTKKSNPLDKLTNQANTDRMVKAYSDALYALGMQIAYSVINKCQETGWTHRLDGVRRDIGRDKAVLDRTITANDLSECMTYDGQGNLTVEVIDNELHKAASKIGRESLGDGMDIVHHAIMYVMEWIDKADKAGETVDLRREVTTRRIRKRVYITDADAAGAWETVVTMPIVEIYRSVRAYIRKSGGISTDPRSKYVYIDDIARDPETGEQTDIYRRMPRYADLGGYECDRDRAFCDPAAVVMGGGHAAAGAYTGDLESIRKYTDTAYIASRLNLSRQQAYILRYRLQGYGYKAIATALHVDQRNVLTQVKRMADKARKAGLDPDIKALQEELARAYKRVDWLINSHWHDWPGTTYTYINTRIDDLHNRIDMINLILDNKPDYWDD